MNLSGILVVTTPKQVPEICGKLNSLEGVEVFHTDEETGRIIVVQEAEAVRDEIDGLKKIKKIPGIVLAEMVHHYFGESAEMVSMQDIPKDLDAMTGLPSAIPAYLNK